MPLCKLMLKSGWEHILLPRKWRRRPDVYVPICAGSIRMRVLRTRYPIRTSPDPWFVFHRMYQVFPDFPMWLPMLTTVLCFSKNWVSKINNKEGRVGDHSDDRYRVSCRGRVYLVMLWVSHKVMYALNSIQW